jgi:hypothetical protein
MVGGVNDFGPQKSRVNTICGHGSGKFYKGAVSTL